MKNSHDQSSQLPFYQRLIHLFQFLLGMVMLLLCLVYGASITTNLLTQLNHQETWLYLLALFICCSVIAVAMGLSYKSIAKHLRQAATGFRSTK